MYHRIAAAITAHYAKSFPAVVIIGPRQSGKTTLARTLFPQLPYVSLEELDTRQRAHTDPRGFLALYPHGAIFDEVQHVPDLLSYLQGILDSSRQKGRFILIGSQNFLLSNQISQSLPGRVGIVTLLPLSLREINEPSVSSSQQILNGGYPALHIDKLSPTSFFSNYIATYVEKDVRQLKNIGNVSTFQCFLKLCAGRIGQLLNVASLAKDCGIAPSTAHEWMSILEASYIVFLLPSYHKNFGKRLVKMPKLYFYDTGLAAALLEIYNESQLNFHYLRGGLFENLAILEILKERLNHGLPPSIYFWRDSNHQEIDVIAEWGGPLKAIELKAAQTMNQSDFKNIIKFQELTSDATGYVIYAGHQQGSYNNITLLSLPNIQALFESVSGFIDTEKHG